MKVSLSLNHRLAYFLGKIFNCLILIPNQENIGNSAEDVFFGILTAKGLKTRLVLIEPRIPKSLKKFKSVDQSYIELFSQYIYPKRKSTRMLIESIFSIYYIFLNLALGSQITQKLFIFFFKYRVMDYFLIPSVGQGILYNPLNFRKYSSSEVSLTSDFYLKAIDSFILHPKSNFEFESLKVRLGLNCAEWFVAFHIRDHYFKNDIRNIRNSNPLNFVPSINRILKAGGGVVILGHSSFKFPIEHQNFIDYRTFDSKSSLWDALIIKYSKFFVATSSGLLDVSLFFDTPVLETNMVHLLHSLPIKKSDRYMFKGLFSKQLNRFLTLREFIEIDTFKLEAQPDPDFDWIDNSPQELELAVVEMLEGSSSCNQIELQKDFKNRVRIKNYETAKQFLSTGSPLNNMNFYRFLSRHELSQSLMCHKIFEERWTSL